jgi:type VI secretion system protein ImpE
VTQSPISALLSDDRLAEAVEQATGEVRTKPQDLSSRLLLVDLLCLQGEFERADRQADTASRLNPAQSVGIALLRGRIRGMDARSKWFSEGAVPSFPGGPSTLDEIALRVGLGLREDRSVDTLLEELESIRGARPAKVGEAAVDDFRDLDDRLPHALEAITDGGAYLWIDISRIASLRFEAARRPLDLGYRSTTLSLHDGSVANVLVPAIYAGTNGSDAALLGRSTEWVEEAGLVTGRGQRSFLAGDEEVGIAELAEIRFEGVDG